MYLKFVRYNQPGGNFCRGTLYSVHFQPNEKGGYNEYRTIICDAYEIPSGNSLPLPLIYRAEVRCVHGHMRLAFGQGNRHSLLHLINRDARKRLIEEVLGSMRERHDCRIEICDAPK